MRILAPRKRDSITGEEVVLTVTNAVVTSTRRSNSTTITGNNNNNNISATCNNNAEAAALVAHTTGSHPHVDLLHEKLLNSSFGSTDCEHVLSSVNYGKQKAAISTKAGHNKVTKKAGKSGHRTTTTTSTTAAGNWRNRIGNSVTDFLLALNAHCCTAQEKQDSFPHENGVVGDKYFARSSSSVKCVVVEDKVVVAVQEEKISTFPERSNASATIITSEESLPSIDANNHSRGENTTSNNNTKHRNNSIIIASPPVIITENNIHVENTKSASDKNLVAAIGTANFKIMRTGIYHEKQVKSLCALHALNNLLQDGKAFKQEDLDKICSELDPNSWVNPHKSVFGLGNYDINVIMTALQQKKLEAVWFDKRKDPSEELNFDNIYGFILNIPSDCRLGWLSLPIKRKHWVAIRNLPSVTEKDAGRSNYYNLDSKFDKPESIGITDNLIEYLRGELKSPEKELFLVVTEDIGKLETWRRNPPPPPSSTIALGGGMMGIAAASGTTTHLLPVPTTSGESGSDAAAGSGNNRRTSNDSGVVDLLPDLRDINVVDLNKEDLMRRQSSGVWSDLT